VTTPQFGTAVPQQRYQIGPFSAVLLGEVESKDERRYRFVLAVIRPGSNEPSLFVTAEPADPSIERGPHTLCVYDESGNRTEVDTARDWAKAGPFAQRALELAAAHFDLSDPPQRLG
jgi:hypothetical protein